MWRDWMEQRWETCIVDMEYQYKLTPNTPPQTLDTVHKVQKVFTLIM